MTRQVAERYKIMSDPVHGFISVPQGLLFRLIETPEVQRLRRVRQLGVGYLVFPGAEHSRFGHALGAMALMQESLRQIQEKGTSISSEEFESAMATALLHDIGHGPFSHTLEHELIQNFEHEDMSRAIMVSLNERFDGALDTALAIFDNTYDRPFFHELVSSQLDMDRLDYLRRDAFYTGVIEGSVGVDRIIKTLRVHPTEGGAGSRVVIDAKGMYSVENFVIARRLMYWQVYLHKTVIAGDHLLRATFARVRRLGEAVKGGSPDLMFFLKRQWTKDDVADDGVREAFCRLDDSDVLYSLKQWMQCDDRILADLSRRFIDRDFPRLTFLEKPPDSATLSRWKEQTAAWMVDEKLSSVADSLGNVAFYLAVARSSHSAYKRKGHPIGVLGRDGVLRELSEVVDTSAIEALSVPVTKPYVCGPKGVIPPN